MSNRKKPDTKKPDTRYEYVITKEEVRSFDVRVIATSDADALRLGHELYKLGQGTFAGLTISTLIKHKDPLDE